MPPDNNNDWPEHAKLVMDTLDRHEKWLKDITKGINSANTNIAMLQVKSGLWGMLGGLAIVALSLLKGCS